MYLKRFIIENFRKYGTHDNTVSFAANKKASSLISSTLVIGQNNAGKTSIVAALKKGSGEESFGISDFNFDYLYSIIDYFYANKMDVKAILIDGADYGNNKRSELLEKLSPYMKFGYEFQVDSINEDSTELLTNIAPIIKNELDEDGVVRAYIKYELKEQFKFIQELCNQFYDKELSEETFDDFVEFLDKGNYFETNIYTDTNCTEKVDNFSINSLIKVRTISCEKLHTPGRF
jgi:GTPase SAR1 family protein